MYPIPLQVDSTISSVKRFASDVVEPKVREMDEQENMDPSIIRGLFEQGVRPIHI
jgi:short/branched chain acyl-CoA dehydrogenase